MTVYQLVTDKTLFPNPIDAEEDGLLAIGGDLMAERLIAAYQKHIFPWYSNDEPILWWAPDPRYVLFPDKLIVSKSLQRVIRSNKFHVKINSNFLSVVTNCGNIKRNGQVGSWINNDFINNVHDLNGKSLAHSIECYFGNVLMGGLYGICVNGVFSGESMFFKMSDASKVALYYLTEFCKRIDIRLIDCQIFNPFLESMGGEYIDMKDLITLGKKYDMKTMKRKWGVLTDLWSFSMAEKTSVKLAKLPEYID